MRDLVRVAVTLTVVGIVAAVLLTGVHNLTEPVILVRQETEYREALESFFPGLSDYETYHLNGEVYDLIKDTGDNLIGIMATVQAKGYDGLITYNLAVDVWGKFVGLRIISHTETPGLGSVIETPEFADRFTGKGVGDPLQIGVDIDAISGATISSSAMINSVRNTMAVIGEIISTSFPAEEKTEFDLSTVPDGIYTGSAQGFNPDQNIVVQVVVSNGRINGIEVQDYGDTPTYFAEAYDLIPQRIIDSQSCDIDIKTGATESSAGIVGAVLDALTTAAGEGGGESK